MFASGLLYFMNFVDLQLVFLNVNSILSMLMETRETQVILKENYSKGQL